MIENKILIDSWVKEIFKLPKKIRITVEKNVIDSTDSTSINLFIGEKFLSEYIIKKLSSEITKDDIIRLKSEVEKFAYSSHPAFAKLFRFAGWWVIFAGSLTMLSVCPICGVMGCPIGVGITGILAGFLAFLKQYLKDIILSVKIKISKLFN